MPADPNRRARRSPFLAVLAALIALAAAGPPADAAGLYVSLGDSVATGVGSSDPAHNSYPARLFAILRTPQGGGLSEWSNRARGGEDSTSLRGAQLSEAIADIDAPSDTRVVTIDIGGNDRTACASAWSPELPVRGQLRGDPSRPAGRAGQGPRSRGSRGDGLLQPEQRG